MMRLPGCLNLTIARARAGASGAGVVVAAGQACSLKRITINSVADTLSESGGTFASHSDPELIRDAVPFSLTLVESLLVEMPMHCGQLLMACSGLTQYA